VAKAAPAFSKFVYAQDVRRNPLSKRVSVDLKTSWFIVYKGG